MGPIRGLKRKNKDEKRVDQNVSLVDASLGYQVKPFDWWDDFSQRITGSLSGSTRTFESVFKISRKTFSYICTLVAEEMSAKTSHCVDSAGKSLSISDQVAVAIRRLGSGESLSIVGESFGISPSTVSQLTWRFVEAMEGRALPRHLSWPSTQAEMDQIKSKFEKIRGLPNCCGAIDTTHVLMTLPTTDRDGNIHNTNNNNNVWLDREGNSSMVLQGIIDPDLRFRDVIAGWPGSLSDEQVLRSSGFFRLSEDGKRLNGERTRLGDGSSDGTTTTTEVREYIVGDSAFPLLPWLMTPHRRNRRKGAVNLPEHRLEFNRRLSATRMVAQRAMARLKDTWRIIHGVMWKPDRNRLPRIVLVCCLLHNIVIDMEDELQDEMSLSHNHDNNYRQQNSDSPDDSDAAVIRENLSLHLAGILLPEIDPPSNGYL